MKFFKRNINRTKQARWRQQILLFALLLSFGIILMTHVQSVDAKNSAMGLSEQYKTRQAELQQFEKQYENLRQENTQLQEKKTQAISKALAGTGNEHLLEELERYKIMAGMTEVQGPGVEILLTDKPDFDLLKDPSDSIVHDADVRYAFRLLQENGATAISVNGMRLVNTTSIDCIGPTILVNENRLAPPYIIHALGDNQRMYEAALADSYFALRAQLPTGIVVNLKNLETVTLPAFDDADQLEKHIDLLEVKNK